MQCTQIWVYSSPPGLRSVIGPAWVILWIPAFPTLKSRGFVLSLQRPAKSLCSWAQLIWLQITSLCPAVHDGEEFLSSDFILLCWCGAPASVHTAHRDDGLFFYPTDRWWQWRFRPWHPADCSDHHFGNHQQHHHHTDHEGNTTGTW